MCDKSTRIITHRPNGCSMFGRHLKKSSAVSSPFIVTYTKRPRFDSNGNIIVDESTIVDVDLMRGIDDLQLLIELNQWMAGIINVSKPMKSVPSFYKIILGQEEDGWLAYEVCNNCKYEIITILYVNFLTRDISK